MSATVEPLDLGPQTTALVTGAASGIGKATALALAKRGVRLVLCDRDAAKLDALAATLGAQVVLLAAVDVSDRAAMKALADRVHALVPALGLLVNNAGVGAHGGLLETPLEDWDWVLGVNLMGVIHGCHFFAPKMAAARRGHIVNVSSTYGFIAGGDVAPYTTSKFAVFGLSESLRAELAPHGVGVSTICPGIIATNIIKTSRFRAGDPTESESRRASAQRMFAGRNYPPEKVADAILAAVAKNKAVVPVAPEAWSLYFLKRLAPGLAAKALRSFGDRATASPKAPLPDGRHGRG